MPDRITITAARSTAEVLAASPLFDAPARPEWADRFLSSAGHHLLLAHPPDSGGGTPAPVGMVSGVELTHPDKGTEMFLYELAVAEDHRRRGVGAALVAALRQLAADRGCYGMWVAVDTDNDPALATYRSAGGDRQADAAMIIWDWGPDRDRGSSGR